MRFWVFHRFLACCWLGLFAGCMTERPLLDQGVGANRQPAGPESGGRYCVHCPDVVQVTVDGHPELSGKRTVGPDGRIDLNAGDRLRIEGRTVPDSVRLVAHEASMQSYQVKVQVAEYNSQQIYVFGPGVGVQRAVSYEGPETVLSLLQRAGAVTSGAAPDDIYVVRPRIAEGGQPQVFPIHLRDILGKKDQETNLQLQPFDQVYIGETRRSSLARCIAPCLRPLYDALCGLRRSDKQPASTPAPANPELTPPSHRLPTYNDSRLGTSQDWR